LYVFICTKSNHLQAYIEPRPSIDCSYLHLGMLLCKARALGMYKATPAFCLVPVNLWVATYSTMQHNYQSIAVIVGIYMYSYVPAMR